MEDLIRKLNSIGKKCFVDNYHEFKNCTDNLSLANKLLNENPKATSVDAQLTRISNAKFIFKNNLEHEALNIIINSNRMDSNTIKEVKSLL